MRSDVHDLAGPYALDAVDADERILFEDHLDSCRVCRDEVIGLREAAAALATDVPAPNGLATRVMAQTLATPQVSAPRGVSRRWFLVGAAAAIAGVAIGGWHLRTREPTFSAVLAADDAQVQVQATESGPVRLVSSAELDRIAVDLRRLRPAGKGRTYQTWRVTPAGKPEPLAVAQTVIVVPRRPGTFAVTVEPIGGSPVPTTEPFVAFVVG